MSNVHHDIARALKGLGQAGRRRRAVGIRATGRAAAVESLELRQLLAAVLNFDVNNFSVAENVGTATITVDRFVDLSGTVTVDYATSDGTATQPADYLPASGTLTFAPGETTKTFTVTIMDDFLAEPTETVNLALSNPTGGAALGSGATASLSIIDDEPTIQFGAPAFSASEGSGNALITLIRSGSLSGPVSVNFSTSDGTALSGADYLPVDTTVTFADAQSQVTVPVPVLQDLLVDGNKTLNLALAASSGPPVGAQATATLTIVDDDSGFYFAAPSFASDESSGSGDVVIQRTGATAVAATVTLVTSDGTATAGLDYAPVNTSVAFAPGETIKTVSVPLVDDALVEGNETVRLELVNTPGQQSDLLVPNRAILTIVSNDSSFQFSQKIYHASEAKGIAAITVTRTGTFSGPATVDYSVSGESATAGADFTPVSGTLNFGPGESSKVFTIPLLADTDAELPETIDLFLRDAQGSNTTVGEPSIAYLVLGDTDTRPPQVVDTTMVRQGRKITGIRLLFNEAIRPGDYPSFADHYTVFQAGGGNRSRVVPLRAADYDAGAHTVTLSARRPLSPNVMYQVNVRSDMGLTDLVGNPLDGNGDGVGGDSFRTFIGFGSRLSYTDHNGDFVRLTLSRGGSMELVQRGDGEAQFVRLFDVKLGRSLLSGTVRAGQGGDAMTEIAEIVASGAQVQLPSSPFSVGRIV